MSQPHKGSYPQVGSKELALIHFALSHAEDFINHPYRRVEARGARNLVYARPERLQGRESLERGGYDRCNNAFTHHCGVDCSQIPISLSL
jgi:hypothetical protein